MNKNSGIYALYWWEQDLVYVGLSQSLKSRELEHYNLMRKNKHTNYKVQNAYDKYGKPEFIVLEYCRISDLTQKEVEWCNEFDALGPNGLCLVEPGIVGFGTNSNASKYSKVQILKTFSLLYKGNHSFKEIAILLGIKEHLPYDICSGGAHLWLKEAYPHQYEIMRSFNRRVLANKLKPLRALIKSPSGEILELYSVSEFCKKEFGDVNQKKHMGSVVTGNRKSHKGYTLIKSFY